MPLRLLHISCLDERLLHKVSNHPVHIMNSEGGVSPSSFIPFCIFGSNMTALGRNTAEFSVPVCNIFEAKVHNEQLCYEVDLELLNDDDDMNHQLKDGLLLILDFNEDIQTDIADEQFMNYEERNYFYSNEEISVQIHLDTISIFI